MLEHPIGFLDGAVMKGVCGARMVLKLGRDSVFKCWKKMGKCTNTRDQLVELWGLVYCEKAWGLPSLEILGYFQVIINWATGLAQANFIVLQH